MKIIGCLCFANSLHNGDKFYPRSVASVLMGYSSTQKGYKLFKILTNTFFVSRDVVFREHIFPFQMIKDKKLQLFPNGVLTPTDTEPIVIPTHTYLFLPLLLIL